MVEKENVTGKTDSQNDINLKSGFLKEVAKLNYNLFQNITDTEHQLHDSEKENIRRNKRINHQGSFP